MNARLAQYFLAHPDLLLGLANGKEFEYRYRDKEWKTVVGCPVWDPEAEYRVKVVPRVKYAIERKDGTTYKTYSEEKTANEEAVEMNEHGDRSRMPYVVVKYVEAL